MTKIYVKRDLLKHIEHEIQQKWYLNNEFEAKINNDKPKFFGTFPYPYMNGVLHIGHAYTVSKLDFYCRWLKQKGYNVRICIKLIFIFLNYMIPK